jgi:hypothetical protein
MLTLTMRAFFPAKFADVMPIPNVILMVVRREKEFHVHRDTARTEEFEHPMLVGELCLNMKDALQGLRFSGFSCRLFRRSVLVQAFRANS